MSDEPKTCLTDGSAPRPGYTDLKENGQQEGYLVLCLEEHAKGFVRPVRDSYKHMKCGSVTTMCLALAETYARNPKFYGGTFCVTCGQHFPVAEFTWEPDGSFNSRIVILEILRAEQKDAPRRTRQTTTRRMEEA